MFYLHCWYTYMKGMCCFVCQIPTLHFPHGHWDFYVSRYNAEKFREIFTWDCSRYILTVKMRLPCMYVFLTGRCYRINGFSSDTFGRRSPTSVQQISIGAKFCQANHVDTYYFTSCPFHFRYRVKVA